MSNRVIPKEQLGDYRRWELESLDERLLSRDSKQEAGVVDQEVEHLSWPTAGEIEAIQQQAHDEGFAAGREEGYASGNEAGRQEGYRAGYDEGREKSQAELDRLKRLMAMLDGALAQFDQELGEDILALSVAIARQITRNALNFRPEALLPVIHEAMAGLPQPNQHPRLILHPDDAALVRSLMDDELAQLHCRIVEDSHVERGGCRVKTESSDVDATLPGRWDRVVAALGRDDKWLG